MLLKHISKYNYGEVVVEAAAVPRRLGRKTAARSGPSSSRPQVQKKKSLVLMQPAHIVYAVVLPAGEC